jgi:hypothetical protein
VVVKKGPVITHGTFFNMVDILWMMVEVNSVVVLRTRSQNYLTTPLPHYLTTKRVERISVPLVKLII